MRLLAEESIALMIDIQEKLLPHMQEPDTLVKNTGILLKGLEILGVPVVISEQYRKGLGPTDSSLMDHFQRFEPLEKMTFSCCDDAGIFDQIRDSGRSNVIIFGIEAHVCVLQTVVDLCEKGFQPVVVEDCISSRKANDKSVAVSRMRQEGAVITTYESLLFELTRISGTPLFKEISRLVK